MEKADRLKLIAGPCVIESRDHVLFMADALRRLTDSLPIDFYFKASWDKANRTKATNYRGPGMEEGLDILADVKKSAGVKIVTDIHNPWQAQPVSEVADVIQIPAFLCRQTDLLQAAAQTGKQINVKKAQFMSPEEMGNVTSKLEYFHAAGIWLCERGTCFGYNDLVVDMTGLVRLKKLGYSVLFDATHSVQISGGGLDYGNSGRSEFVPCLAKAAVATGSVDGIFMEVHNEPQNARCDGSCMLRLDQMDVLLRHLLELWELGRKYNMSAQQA